VIVCNATPLIAFSRIQRLDLLHDVVGNIVIPDEVADEISRCRHKPYGEISLERESWISVQQVQSAAQVRLLLPVLDRGEAEVIALALERQAKLVLIDELTGRKVAQSLELPVTGTVGILIRAKQKGLISAVGPLLEKMRRDGIRYSERFIQAVLRELGE
jgi:predicted nucleic acid-binding protein